MIYELSRDLEASLQARKFPLRIAYGEIVNTTRPPPVRSRLKMVRDLAVIAVIYAKASEAGAHIGDHERLCEKLVDAFQCALYDWSVEAKSGTIPITEARYLSKENAADVELWPDVMQWGHSGVLYALRFSVPRGVYLLDFENQARPTGAPTGVRNRTEARRAGSQDEDEDPEIGCGA